MPIHGVTQGYCIKYDVSLPKEYYIDFVETSKKYIEDSDVLSREEKDILVKVGYGHVGDGDIHLFVSLPGFDDHDL